MTSGNVVPELKQVLGAMLFGSRQPVSKAELRKVLLEVAETQPEEGKAFAKVAEADIAAALEELKKDLAQQHLGLRLVEVAGGFRFQTDVECGPWLRHLLDIGKPTKLSRPTLETLAIIAYRQPITRAEIESVRGVTVDTIVRNLLELQLIRIVGRSPLPGRPLLLGTTQLFLEHFGLKDLKDLPGIEQLCRKEDEFVHRPRPAAAAAPAEGVEAAEEETEALGAGGEIDAAGKTPADAGAAGKKAAPEKEAAEDEDEYDDEDDEDDDEDEDEDDEEAEDRKRSSAPGKGKRPEGQPAAQPAEEGGQDDESQGAQKND